MKRLCVALALLGLILLVGCKPNQSPKLEVSEAPVVQAFQPPETVVYKIDGFCFGPFLTGSPMSGPVTVEEAERLFDQMKYYTTWVRIYSVMPLRGSKETLASVAKRMGLKVAAGCWLSSSSAANQLEIKALFDACKKGDVDMIIVGSEVLLRKDLPEDELITEIQNFKQAFPKLTVTTSEDWRELLKHPKVIAACDLLMVNIYPCWDGVALSDAPKMFNQHYEEVVRKTGGKKVIIGETGWPSGGVTIGKAEFTVENAAKYCLNIASWGQKTEHQYFYFEAFDEPWKVSDEGTLGAHWGIWDTEKKMKPGFEKVFAGQTVADNWSPPQPPGIKIDPEFKDIRKGMAVSPLSGTVAGVDTTKYKVAVYIKVEGKWWTKPTFADPDTPINDDGTWNCDIMTGGKDYIATEYAAYLVKKDKVMPQLQEASDLPKSLKDMSISHDRLKRKHI